MLTDTVGALQYELPGIKIDIDAPSDICAVIVDVAQIQELLLNLATNVHEAMPDGGTLTLSLADRAFTAADLAGNLDARPGAFVELCVRDTGRGMPPEIHERIFEPFFSTKKQAQGAGMGLSVVFGIVKGHKGWITVDSQPGVGTAFHVYLPAARASVPVALPVALPVPATARTHGERILVVDDESLVRNLAQTVLECRGFRVVTAEDGDEAVEIYRREADSIDLVLLDYIMPRMNGVQVLKELQQLNPRVRVLFSSGYHSDHDVEQLLASGARGFVAKPYRDRISCKPFAECSASASRVEPFAAWRYSARDRVHDSTTSSRRAMATISARTSSSRRRLRLMPVAQRRGHVVLARRVGVAQVVQVGVAQIQEMLIHALERAEADKLAAQIDDHALVEKFFQHRTLPICLRDTQPRRRLLL